MVVSASLRSTCHQAGKRNRGNEKKKRGEEGNLLTPLLLNTKWAKKNERGSAGGKILDLIQFRHRGEEGKEHTPGISTLHQIPDVSDTVVVCSFHPTTVRRLLRLTEVKRKKGKKGRGREERGKSRYSGLIVFRLIELRL